MDYITLSDTDIRASRIGIGTWAMGGWMWGGTDEELAIESIHTAFEAGINLVDTAPVYGFGVAEEIVGRALESYGRRKDVVLATKAGLDWTGNRIRRNSSRERLLKEIEDSLRRLRTDYIDIYQIHWPDTSVPFEETASLLNDLQRQGLIRAVGVSNFSPEQMDQFRRGGALHTNQPPYNLLERDIERDVLPYCLGNGIATLTYGAICRGLLSGRMREDTKFEGDDLRKMDPKFRKPRYLQYLDAVEKLDRFAQKNFGKRVIHLAVRRVLDQPGVSVALWGIRRPEQVKAMVECTGWSLSPQEMQEIDRIVEETITDSVGPEFMAPPENG